MELDVESKVFEEDVSLKNFLQGDYCRLAYIKHQLLPFISSNTSNQCIEILTNPGEKIQKATVNFVKQMASGGIKTISESSFTEPCTNDDMNVYDENSKFVLEEIYKLLYPDNISIKSYKLARMSEINIPTTSKGRGKSGRKTDHIKAEMTRYPFVMRYFQTSDTFKAIDIDWQKLRSLTKDLDKEVMGSLESCGVIWDVKKEVFANIGEGSNTIDIQNNGEFERQVIDTKQEIIDYSSLKSYSERGTDKKQNKLLNYLRFVELNG